MKRYDAPPARKDGSLLGEGSVMTGSVLGSYASVFAIAGRFGSADEGSS